MIIRFLIAGVLTISQVAIVQSVMAQDAPQVAAADMPDDKVVGYFLGFSVGQNMGQSGFKATDLSLESFLAGFKDGVAVKEPALSEAQLKAAQEMDCRTANGNTVLAAQVDLIADFFLIARG